MTNLIRPITHPLPTATHLGCSGKGMSHKGMSNGISYKSHLGHCFLLSNPSLTHKGLPPKAHKQVMQIKNKQTTKNGQKSEMLVFMPQA